MKKITGMNIIKNELAKKRGFNLMRIWSDEFEYFDMGKLL